MVQNKIIAEYERRLHGDQSSNVTSNSILKPVARVGRCYFCKKAGHQRQHCIKYKQWTQKPASKIDGKVNKISVKETTSVKTVDNTGIEMVFLGYDHNSKAFRCYDPLTKKVNISRDVRFVVDLRTIVSDEKVTDTEKEIMANAIPKYTNESLSANGKKIHEEVSVDGNEFPKEVSVGGNAIQEEYSTNPIRISQRLNIGIPPRRFVDEIFVTAEQVEPSSYNEAISCKEKKLWLGAMQDCDCDLRDFHNYFIA